MNGGSESGAIEVVEAAKRYRGGVGALTGATLSLARGKVGALVGPNGSGKSTLLKLAAGILSPTSGRVEIEGRPATSAAARARIGYLPESPQFPSWLRVREFLHYLGELSGLRGDGLEQAISHRLEWAGLAALADRPAGTLSTGQRQRLGLAQALVHGPPVLLLDEPAAALDPSGVATLVALLRRLRDEGRTVLLSSHFLPQVEAVCDRVWLLREGRVVWAGTPDGPGELEKRFMAAGATDAGGD